MAKARLASHLQDQLGRNLLTIKERMERQWRHPIQPLSWRYNKPSKPNNRFRKIRCWISWNQENFLQCAMPVLWTLQGSVFTVCVLLGLSPVSGRKILKAKKTSRARRAERLRARLHFQTVCIVCFIVRFILCLHHVLPCVLPQTVYC